MKTEIRIFAWCATVALAIGISYAWGRSAYEEGRIAGRKEQKEQEARWTRYRSVGRTVIRWDSQDRQEIWQPAAGVWKTPEQLEAEDKAIAVRAERDRRIDAAMRAD